MDTECKHVLEAECEHKIVEVGEGIVFCAECGLEIDRFYGYSYSGFKKKVKNYHCDKCNKSFLKDSSLQRHLKSHF